MMRGLEHERESAIVFVVDDDPSIREALDSLLHSVRLGVQTFASARDFLASKRPDMPSCLVLDVQLPGLSGLGLQQELAKANIQIPIIFITGHGDIPTSVRAMKAGAVEFLTKPFRDKKLLDAIDEALKRDRAARSEQAKLAELQGCYESLTPREREVMAHVTAGMLNKQIAAQLHTVEKTIKFHRAHIMEKMGAGSLAELVSMAADLGVLRPRTRT
jgi:FixJ family two-component response regulator